ncbi:MAG: hypothetical protein HRU09_19695 [Oligoflexales bacterium]|nr:hypothetical protein [Oligoflexales bacterium]
MVKKIYSENFGVENYTWQTDGENEYGRGHYFEVASGLKHPITPRKAIAAFMHDLERFFPKTKVPYINTIQLTLMNNKSIDGTLRKKAMHPRNSAKLANLILDDNKKLSSQEKFDIYHLILYHDAGENGLRIDFTLEEKQTSVEILPPLSTVNKNLVADLRDLSDADALAFFRKTVPHFILREVNKIKEIYDHKVSDEKINQILEARIVETLYERIKNPGDRQIALRWMLTQRNFHPSIESHWEYVKHSILEKTPLP